MFLGLAAIFIFSFPAVAGPPAVHSRGGNVTFENVFSGAQILGRQAMREQFERAPLEVRTAIEANLNKYGKDQYVKLSVDGKSGYTLAPQPNMTRATIQSVHTETAIPMTQEFSIATPQSAKMEILNQRQVAAGIMKDGHSGFPLSAGGDLVPSVPVRVKSEIATANLEADNVYSILKADGEDRRFTLFSRLWVDPKDGPKGHYANQGKGDLIWQYSPNTVILEAKVFRDSLSAPINKADLNLRLKRDAQSSHLTYELPPSKDGNKTRQILDIQFSHKAGTDEQLMVVTATDGERLSYKIEKSGDSVKLGEPKRTSLTPLEMTEYRASTKTLPSRRVVEPNGDGSKGLETEVGR